MPRQLAERAGMAVLRGSMSGDSAPALPSLERLATALLARTPASQPPDASTKAAGIRAARL